MAARIIWTFARNRLPFFAYLRASAVDGRDQRPDADRAVVAALTNGLWLRLSNLRDPSCSPTKLPI
jgi:hypothetical protein